MNSLSPCAATIGCRWTSVLESLSRQLVEARNEVASLDHRAMTLAGQLAEAQRRLRESDKPAYAGLGSRIEQLLRNAEEQSASILQRPTARQIAC